tara:strand:- start:83 stop:1111 length:1029 start_codon:yes stop_codon:yes gene_type:complete
MGYKTKSMIKQLSGLSAEYYLDKELNKYTNKISEKPKQGESIANNSKKFTPFKFLKSKDSARDREEKKQIRKAGREAARNADVDFVKATPMGSDYFSLMAATAENLASRGAGKRKARKEAKSLKRERLSEGRDVKPMDRKGILPLKVEGVKRTQAKKTTPSSSKGDTRGPINVDMPDMTNYIESKRENAQYEYDQNKDKINTEAIKRLSTFPQKAPEVVNDGKEAKTLDPVYHYEDRTPRYDIGINTNTGEEYIKRNLSPASRAIGETVRGVTDSIVDFLTTPFSDEAVAKRKAKLEQTKQESEQRQKERGLDLKKIKQSQGLPMMGDGFNKGMSRKNKYKK